jgi:hypothetical protein
MELDYTMDINDFVRAGMLEIRWIVLRIPSAAW